MSLASMATLGIKKYSEMFLLAATYVVDNDGVGFDDLRTLTLAATFANNLLDPDLLIARYLQISTS